MDFIFEEDMDEVGSDIEAYCPKCKADTAHTVITKYEDEVRRVQCSTCGDVHAYRKPRGEVEDEQPEPVAAKKRAAAKKPTWQEAMTKAGNKAVGHARPYTIRDHYHEGDIVSHPKFGVGFVTEISENKAEVTFQDERRVLVHNRPDLAAQMPAIAPFPAPREEKVKSKRGGKKVAAEAPPPPVVVAPAPAAISGKPGKPSAPSPVVAPTPIKAVAAKVEKVEAKKPEAKAGKRPEAAAAPPPVVVAKKPSISVPPVASKAPSVTSKAVLPAVGKSLPPISKSVPPVSKSVPPVAAAKVVPPVQGKAARAQAAAKKKGAAKGKPAAAAAPAKPAARPAKPAAAAARSVRPAGRVGRAEPPKGKLNKKKAGKAR